MADIINRLNIGHIVNVKLTDSATVNGQNFIDAYNYAKTLTPNGQALSSTNRVAIILQPGNYTLTAELAINTQYVDIIGLGAQKLRRGAIPAVIIGGNTLNVTANDVRVQGISVGTQAFKTSANLPLQIFEDCVGGAATFIASILSGTFINCIGGNNSFGASSQSIPNPTANGTFINCVADNGFGGDTTGLFVNCEAKNVAGGTGSFSTGKTADGTYINCESAAPRSFGSTSLGSIPGIASGTFTNCTAGNNSFGGGSGSTATGKFYQCRLTFGTFQTVIDGGLMRECIDGNNNIVDQ